MRRNEQKGPIGETSIRDLQEKPKEESSIRDLQKKPEHLEVVTAEGCRIASQGAVVNMLVPFEFENQTAPKNRPVESEFRM